MIRRLAPVAELVDAADSKSVGGDIVLVRVRPGAPEFLKSHPTSRPSYPPTARRSMLTTLIRVAQPLPKFGRCWQSDKPVRRTNMAGELIAGLGAFKTMFD